MLTVKSAFDATAIVPADAQGPYVVDAGTPVTLSAGHTHPDATYEWDLGDGTVAHTHTVTHVYADNGVYLAKLKVVVNQPGGATSRHFAIVRARNVAPVVQAGPDRTVNEGDVVPFTGTFTDTEYPDTHEARWDWGDYQAPDAGVVTETHNPPQAVGAVTGSHAWGDNGTYTVTLAVRDDDGGVGEDTLTVTVLNVPPTVDAGPDLYAYPCTVISLTAGFVDPGWLDTHVGTWDFGDCTPPTPAVIRERHDPPKGTGVAIASHVYQACGTYPAVCTVIDDDGGVGEDTALIRVVDVRNKGFEDGFRERVAGAVGNAWEPYQAEIGVFGAPPPQELDVSVAPHVFFAAEYPLYGGQRAQRIHFDGDRRFGVRQRVGANEGWDYQITGWYSLGEKTVGMARLGVDPTGGTDPTSPVVTWSEGSERREWRQLSVRVTARKGGYVTIFFEGQGEVDRTGARGACDLYIDDVALLAVQPFCVEPEAPRPPEVPTERCVDFDGLQPGEIGDTCERQQFIFESMDRRPLRVVSWGLPAGRSKLLLGSGVIIHLPFAAARVRLTVYEPSSATVDAVATDGRGATVASAKTVPAKVPQVIVLKADGITAVACRGGSGETVLIEACAELDPRTARPARKRRGDG